MLQVTKQNGVARVALNRPELRNAFDDALIANGENLRIALCVAMKSS